MRVFASRSLSLLAAGVALSLLWLVATPRAEASHYVFMAQGANDAGNGTYTWAMKTWVIEGQTTRFCVGFAVGSTERQATFDAIADWESQFAFPFGEFLHECGPAQRLDVVDNIGWSGYNCTPGAVACVEPFWAYDSGRQGYYLNTVRIWVNRAGYGFNYNGMRSVIAHELGHVYGLNDAYLHNPFGACNNNILSIMDGPVIATGTVVGGCDSNVVLSYDMNNAHAFNVMHLSNFQPQNLDSIASGFNAIRLYWDDYSPTDRYYRLWMRYLWANVEYTCYILTFSDVIAYGDPWAPNADLNKLMTRSTCPVNTFYRGCMYLDSGVIGNRYWRCSPNWHYLTQ